MTTDYAERLDRAMHDAYGPFTPGSEARAIRSENAKLGFRTCWHCLERFRPERRIGGDGRLHRPGRGRWFCSRRCALADRAARLGTDIPTIDIVGGELVLDLRRFRRSAV